MFGSEYVSEFVRKYYSYFLYCIPMFIVISSLH